MESLNEKDTSGKTAFIWACKKGQLEIAKWIYSQELFSYERISEKQISIRQRLKKRIIDINEKDDEGIDALMRACIE